MSGYDRSMPKDGLVNGIMLATVLSNEDDKNKGCLKLQLLREGTQTSVVEGVKMMASLAGESYGAYALPEVGDQVLVGFLDGCIDRPVVLGALYSRKDAMLSESYQKKNTIKRLKTKAGTIIELCDEKDKESIVVKTPKKLSFEMKQSEESITITTGDTSVKIDGKNGKLHMKGQKEILLECGSATIKLESSGAVKIQSNQLEVKGSSIKLDSSGTLEIKGQKSALSGAMIDVNSQGVLTLKGSITKIN